MITQFALLLSHGMSLMWCLMPRSQVTSGFFRIQLLVVLGLSVLAYLAAGQLSPGETRPPLAETILKISIVSCAVISYIGSMLWRLERRTGGTWCLFAVWLVTLVGIISLPWSQNRGDASAPLLAILSACSGAAVLGGATTGMLLGHWYLTAPTMSIEPLKRLTLIFFGALLVRMILAAYGWAQAQEALHGSLIWTWLALRWLAGIVAPLILAVMTLRILRYRNTQAATGVLFAGVILVFLGEMSAELLLAELRRPL
jgi:hypothetical protein